MHDHWFFSVYLIFFFFFQLGHWRSKRNHNITYFSTCSQDSVNTMEGCLSKKNEIQKKFGQHVRYNLKCVYETQSCFYVVNCYPTGQGKYLCKEAAHFLDYLDVCCNLVC